MNPTNYTSKDFTSNQEVRWCPGCGDYSILKQMQSVLPQIGIPKEKMVFVSGIGCSSRFPYYMDTFGIHGIHGRAPAIATGIKLANPELCVFIITGDGDGLSIGGNHMIHLLRRNLDVNVLLFNNEIYGLTKGQFSPTSSRGTKTKSSPLGSIDKPFNPLSLVAGASSTFIARSMDKEPSHLREMLKRAQEHRGTSFLEIYQNCLIFNDGVFGRFSDKHTKEENTLYLEHGKPLIFGSGKKGIYLDGLVPKIVSLEQGNNFPQNLWIHDEKDSKKAHLLISFFDQNEPFPRPFGVIYAKDQPTYENLFFEQLNIEKEKQREISLDDVLAGSSTWEVK